ncbi:bacteriophage protein [Shigella flexneri]|nr:bacteriophage protein [Shigella flexneri]
MIYPTNTGKSGEHLRLTTLESVWIQGKLRMWGRWSYIGVKWSTKTGHRVRVFPVSIFRFVWG